jgi:hypothetical protein
VLRQADTKGILFIDDAPRHQRQLNQILEGLASLEDSSLAVITTFEASQWAIRTKSPLVFTRGTTQHLSRLDPAELDRLVSLSEHSAIRALVEPAFAQLSRRAKRKRLQDRCDADMFVALKNIFASDLLDNIILKEYASLSEPDLIDAQTVYRTVALLEVGGATIHRQILIRLLALPADEVSRLLDELDGIVEEYDIRAADGLFGWRTRHPVIASIIARYKFAEPARRAALLRAVIQHFNPAIPVERRSLIDLCVSDNGIRGLPDPLERIELYESLADVVPDERVPRHRLVREYIDNGSLDQADASLREAIEEVGYDPPLGRYRVLLLVARAENTEGVLVEDRRALLTQAWKLATEAAAKPRADMYTHFVLWDVAKAFGEVVGDASFLEQAIASVQLGYDRLQDPEMVARLRRMQSDVPHVRRRAEQVR